MSTYYQKAKDGTVHSWHWFKNGSILFRKNFSISQGLLRRKCGGDELTFREQQLLVKTTADVLKLIPFSFFVIVPFAELLLPVVLKVWPQILPSTFDAKKLFPQAPTDRSRRLLAKQEMLKFFSEISIQQDMDAHSKKAADEKSKMLNQFRVLLSKPRMVGQPLPSVDELLKISSLFQTEFKVDNMPMKHLESICYLIGLDPYPFRSHVILQLKRYIGEIKREDRNVSWEGIDSLTREELIEANRRRGMPHDEARSNELLKQQLEAWIEISSNRSIPISLLLWTRAFFVTENPELLHIESNAVVSEAKQETSFTTTSDVGETSSFTGKEDEVLKRIAELEKLEQEAHEVSDQDRSAEIETEKNLQQQISLIEQKSQLVKSQLVYLSKIKRMKRNRNIDAELKKIEKSFGVENRRIDSLIRKVLKETKELKVPENIQKKLANNEALLKQKEEALAKLAKMNVEKRSQLKKRTIKYLKEYRSREANLVRLRRQARASGNFFVEPEAKLLFVTRLIGINKMAPKPRKILQLFRLKQLHNAVFLKINGPITQMLRTVAPYVAFGNPSLATVRKLVYKRGYMKIDGSRIPLTDNALISKKLGHLGIHGAEDIIHEIFTVGPNFKEVNRALWPFKLTSPRGGFVRKRHGFHEPRGGDWGNREHLINSLVEKML